ncbi:MAG: hypothetical protein ACFHVJ_00500 [Aestuariibacter sp.]
MKLFNLLAGVCLLASQASIAAEATITARVNDVLFTSDEAFGACMAQLSVDIADNSSLNCPAGWVSFSCTGHFMEKEYAYRMFDTAQLAFALDSRVRIRVSDAKKHNGWCTVVHMTILKK